MVAATFGDAVALLVVDLQYDFMPGGAVAVAGGDEIDRKLASALRAAGGAES